MNKYYGEMIDIYICRALAAKNGGECLSDNFSNWRTKLSWRCKVGHEWKALYGNIKYGSWCPKCRSAENGRKRMKNNLSRAQEAATAKGGRCLADQSFPMHHNIGWVCQKGHQWQACLDNVIHNGTWCSKCFVESRRKDNLSRAQVLAAAKGGLCLATENFSIKTHVKWECAEGHQWETAFNLVRRGSWCPKCFVESRRKDNLSKAHVLAAAKGGLCLAKENFTTITHVKWECAEGHQWETAFYVVRQGSWCPKCFMESRRKDNLSEAHVLAAAKGGLCLATENFTTITHVKWECAEGHQWETAFRVVKRGSWCPKCARVKIHKNCLHDDLSHGREIAAHGDSL